MSLSSVVKDMGKQFSHAPGGANVNWYDYFAKLSGSICESQPYACLLSFPPTHLPVSVWGIHATDMYISSRKDMPKTIHSSTICIILNFPVCVHQYPS